MTLFVAVFAFVLGLPSISGAVDENYFPEDGSRPAETQIMVGDKKIVRGIMTHRDGIVMDDEGTIHVLSISGASKTSLFRVSRKGVAKELIIYRGWPYILDKHGRLLAFDASWARGLINKLPYLSLRFLKTLPLALGTGLGFYAVGMIDSTFVGMITSGGGVDPAPVFGGGVLLFYGVDIANTLFLKSQSSIADGGNFFTRVVAKGVTSIIEDQNYDDFIVETKGRRRTLNSEPLSQLVPRAVAGRDCMDFLTRLTVR